MEVINARSALLSNFEVLTLLRELEGQHLAQSKTALRIKKEDEQAGNPISNYVSVDQVSDNLRTVEVEDPFPGLTDVQAIQYLSAEFQPTQSQSEAGISKLVKDLSPFGFTKAEKLQVVNLAPTEAVELYVIIEEPEDRLGDRMSDVLSVVQASLSAPPEATHMDSAQGIYSDGSVQLVYPSSAPSSGELRWDGDAPEPEFDDSGEGAGVEGDLDMEDD